ncbi:hypothetical protein [Amycolatopsis mediterranei]|uniref:hypothetical protein n=1 Tax=Amycolatopsis mediterranei TaxID=33910 RepID=UPI003F4D92B2
MVGNARDVRGLVPFPAKNARLSEHVIDALSETGVFRLRTPARYGGYEAGTGILVEIAAELGRGDRAATGVSAVYWIPAWMACRLPGGVRSARRAVGIVYGISSGSSIYFYIPIQCISRDVHAISKHALMNLEKNVELYGASYAARSRELYKSSRMKQFMTSSQTPAAEAVDIAASARKIIAPRACRVPRRRLRRPHHAGRLPGHGGERGRRGAGGPCVLGGGRAGRPVVDRRLRKQPSVPAAAGVRIVNGGLAAGNSNVGQE